MALVFFTLFPLFNLVSLFFIGVTDQHVRFRQLERQKKQKGDLSL